MTIKRIIAGLGIAAAATVGTIFIDNDGGGNVLSYVRYYDDLHNRGVPVVIRDSCRSSCTMALGYDNACLMPEAVLGFHPAYTPILFGLFSYIINPSANAVMLAHYPADARKVIDRHGDMTHDTGGWWYPRVFYIKATEFPEHYLCGHKT